MGRIIKLIVVLFIALIWVISPIDLVPDAMPIVGVIDDAIIALLGAGVVRQGFSLRRRGQGALAVLD